MNQQQIEAKIQEIESSIARKRKIAVNRERNDRTRIDELKRELNPNYRRFSVDLPAYVSFCYYTEAATEEEAVANFQSGECVTGEETEYEWWDDSPRLTDLTVDDVDEE